MRNTFSTLFQRQSVIDIFPGDRVDIPVWLCLTPGTTISQNLLSPKLSAYYV